MAKNKPQPADEPVEPLEGEVQLKAKGVVETKVTAGSLGALASGLVLAVLLSLADDPSRLAGLPEWASWLIMVMLPVLITFLAAYRAPHTNRPDLA